MGYAELHIGTYLHHKDYYLRQSYVICDMPPQTLGANVLLSGVAEGTHPRYLSWHGNILYPGLESVYKGGAIATEKEVLEGKAGVFFMKYLKN